jgi:hypothetical protein
MGQKHKVLKQILTRFIRFYPIPCPSAATVTEVILLLLNNQSPACTHVGTAGAGCCVYQCVFNVNVLLSDQDKN